MAKADSVHSTPPTNTSKIQPLEVFDNLAMAVPPKWGDSILRLAEATERVAAKLEELPSDPADPRYIPKARELARTLIDFLDNLDADPDLEPTMGFEHVPGSDECEIPEDAEPSLGSFDRMINQEKAWRTVDRNPDIYGWSGGVDNELDDCDYEPSLGSLDHDHHPNQERWAAGGRRDIELDDAEASGIGDHDGLDEQVPFQDWQNTGMI
jgi:hypothetical protein